jgi:hypothetical protein
MDVGGISIDSSDNLLLSRQGCQRGGLTSLLSSFPSD